MKLVSTFILVCLLPIADAHPPDDAPTSVVRAGGAITGHGGYGYIHADANDIESEAAASSLMDFSCRVKDLRQNLATYCSDYVSAITDDIPVVNDVMQSIVFDEVRKKAIEYYAMNLTAATRGTSHEFDPQTLLQQGSPNSFGCNINKATPMHSAISNPSSAEGRAWGARQATVDKSLNSMEMARALITREWMKSAMGTRAPEPLAEELHDRISDANRGVTRHQFFEDLGLDSEDGDDKHSDDFRCSNPPSKYRNNCTALRGQIHRLETNFPALYPSSSRDSTTGESGAVIESPFLFDTKFRTNFKPGLMTGIRDLMVANGASWKAMTSAMKESRSYGGFVAAEDAFISAYKAAQGATASEAQRLALEKFNLAVSNIKKSHSETMRKRLRSLCGQNNEVDLTQELRRIALLNPNIIRQAMVDLPPSQRYLAKNVLCKSGLASRINPPYQCHGVSGGPLPTNDVVSARRRANDFPFTSEHYTTISQKTENSPRTINLSVNMVIGPNVDVSKTTTQTAINNLVQSWQTDVNAYSNCQLGSPVPPFEGSPAATYDGQTCPPDAGMRRTPPVRVNITLNIKPQGTPATPPTMYLHDCFRTELGSGKRASNCETVRQFSVDRCVAGGSSEQYCNNNTPAKGDPTLNRANSGNVTRSSRAGTMRHELLHLMGLNDEYEDRAYTFNQIGEHDSIMNSSNSSNSRLYPRHVDQMLAPTQCENVRGL